MHREWCLIDVLSNFVESGKHGLLLAHARINCIMLLTCLTHHTSVGRRVSRLPKAVLIIWRCTWLMSCQSSLSHVLCSLYSNVNCLMLLRQRPWEYSCISTHHHHVYEIQLTLHSQQHLIRDTADPSVFDMNLFARSSLEPRCCLAVLLACHVVGPINTISH